MLFGFDGKQALSIAELCALVVLLVRLVIILVLGVRESKDARDKADKKITKWFRDQNLESVLEHRSKSSEVFVAIDEKQKKVAFGRVRTSEIEVKCYGVSELQEVRIAEDGKVAVGKDIGQLLSLAAAGAVIFGGAGAVVGALAGSSLKQVREVLLVAAVDDVLAPFVAVNFLETQAPVGSERYKKATQTAERFMGAIEVLKRREMKAT